MQEATRHYVLVYDRRAGTLTDAREYAASERALALRHRFALERKHRKNRNLEVVSLSAESWDALKRTHSRYFSEVLNRRVSAG